MNGQVTVAPRTMLVFFVLLSLGMGALTFPAARAQDVSVYEIEGVVQNEDAAALKDASVSLIKKADGKSVGPSTTDASGGYKFSMLAAGDYVVSASHACCLRASVGVTVGGATLKTTAPALQLAPKEAVQGGDPVKLSGVVRSTKDDAAVASVRVDIQSSWYASGDSTCSGDVCKPSGGSQSFSIETDAAGRFELNVNRGSAYVRASLVGYDTTAGSIQMDSNRDVTIPLQPTDSRTVRLHGVLTGDDGKTLADAWLQVSPDYRSPCPANADCMAPTPAGASGYGDGQWTYESANPQYNSTQARPDGSWEMRVAGGRLVVSAHAENYIEAFKSLEAKAGDDVVVDLVLEAIPPDSVTVGGRVVDRASGKPVAHAQVSAENQKWGSFASAQTDEEGQYKLSTKPGFTILTARADVLVACIAESGGANSGIRAPCEAPQRDTEYLPAVVSFVAEKDGSRTQDFKLASRPSAQSEFKGYAVNASSGKAVPNATVTFYNEITRDWGSAVTDADGSYKIQVHQGYYSIRVWAQHYFDAVANAEIDEKENQRLDLQITPGEKRYGYWAYGGYAVTAQDGGGKGAPSATAAPQPEQEPPMPSDGQKVYEGSGGGLGPYKGSAGSGGAAPALGAPALLAFSAAVFVAGRRRKA